MALRVLLADNSDTIRKVMQLSLQDFAAEVKTVALGVDVREIARSFKPDIIFVDVLLQKKNGYEVSVDVKSDPTLAPIPIVLMWSNFMEIDPEKFKQCGANDKIEKPFDSAALKEIVQRWVPKAKVSPLAQHLVPPQLPKVLPPQPQAITPPFEALPGQSSQVAAEAKEPSWNMESFEDINKFHGQGSDVAVPDAPDAGAVVTPAEMEKDLRSTIASQYQPLPDLELELSGSADDFQIHSMQTHPDHKTKSEISLSPNRPDAKQINASPREIDLKLEIDSHDLGLEGSGDSEEWVKSSAQEFELPPPVSVNLDDFVFAPPDAVPAATPSSAAKSERPSVSISESEIERRIQREVEIRLPALVEAAVQKWVTSQLPEYAVKSIEKEINRLISEVPSGTET